MISLSFKGLVPKHDLVIALGCTGWTAESFV